MKKMKVDGYEVENEAIADVIEKLMEADGSCESRLSYLADASKMLAYAIAEIASEQTEERLQEE